MRDKANLMADKHQWKQNDFMPAGIHYIRAFIFYIHIYICMYVCMYVCVCVCVCVCIVVVTPEPMIECFLVLNLQFLNSQIYL